MFVNRDFCGDVGAKDSFLLSEASMLSGFVQVPHSHQDISF